MNQWCEDPEKNSPDPDPGQVKKKDPAPGPDSDPTFIQRRKKNNYVGRHEMCINHRFQKKICLILRIVHENV